MLRNTVLVFRSFLFPPKGDGGGGGGALLRVEQKISKSYTLEHLLKI